MRRSVAWGWVAALAVIVGAAGLAAANGKGVLTGFVENEKSKPVVGAEVYVDVPGKPPLKGVTDANGKFSITGVPVGSVKVRILAKGCYPWQENVVIAGKGSTSTAATLKLGVRLAGKVSDERGAPLEGASVRAIRQRKDTDTITWNDIFADDTTKLVKTGADGAFQIDGLAPARRYQLIVRHVRHKKAEVGDLPGKAGAVKEGIEVKMEDAAWVTGVVTDAAGKAVAKARIGGGPDSPPIQAPKSVADMERKYSTVFSNDFDDWNLSDDKGRFTLGGITDGNVEVVVDADGFFVARAAVADLVAGKEKADVHVVLEPATAFLEGWVVDKKGKPIDHADVTLTAEGGEVAAKGDVAENGSFKFPSVRAKGPVTLRASAWEYSDTTMEKVELNKKGLRVTLAPAPTLKLKVVDESGALVPEVEVTVTTKEAEGGSNTSTRSHTQPAAGLVLFVSPGEVSVEVSADDYESARAGPWTVKAGQVVDGGTVTLKK
jgi:protocatechuate 3,4-dioxygenase beta subunit